MYKGNILKYTKIVRTSKTSYSIVIREIKLIYKLQIQSQVNNYEL